MLKTMSQSSSWNTNAVTDPLLQMELQEKVAVVNGKQHKEPHEPAQAPLLVVDPKKLRGEEEMRRIFGARILREEERENAGGD